MGKSKIVGIGLSAIIFLMAALSAYAATYTVCPAGPPTCDFATIQAAISDVGTINGDIISVAADTYAETLNINKAISIVGVDRDTVFIDASSFTGYAIGISSSNVNLSSFTLIGTQVGPTGYAIKPDSGLTGITIEDITVQNSGRTGIDFYNIGNSIIRNVEVTNSALYGIFIRNGGGITLEDITTSGNDLGGIHIFAETGNVNNIVFLGAIDAEDICDFTPLVPGLFVECGFYTQVNGAWTINGPFTPYYSYKLQLPTVALGYDLYFRDFATASNYAFIALDKGINVADIRIIDLSTGTDAVVVPGSVSILINGGSDSTSNAILSLAISAVNANQMQFSCDNVNWVPLAWDPYATSRSFYLGTAGSGCNTNAGLKTVSVRVINFFNYVDPVGPVATASDSITFAVASGGTPAGTGTGTVISANVTQTGDSTCVPPEIRLDRTARGWYPNDQTWYNADIYGGEDDGGKYNCGNEYDRFIVPMRQNYAFTGETLDYYVLIRDADGVDDIASVQLLRNGLPVGACSVIGLDPASLTSPCAVSADMAAFGLPGVTFDSTEMRTYVCRLIVQNGWTDESEISVQVTDSCGYVVRLTDSDLMNFNPSISLSFGGSIIDFGDVTPGSVAVSNTVNVENTAEDGSGVVLDLYIASDDYFTDPSDSAAICGTGNGIKYDRFSYYATKGSSNSGANDNSFPWLGVPDVEGFGNPPDLTVDPCEAGADEFTRLTSHSGAIRDMCRVINDGEQSSLLAQGAEMSLTFKLDLTPYTAATCHGEFSQGEFHVVGIVV